MKQPTSRACVASGWLHHDACSYCAHFDLRRGEVTDTCQESLEVLVEPSNQEFTLLCQGWDSRRKEQD